MKVKETAQIIRFFVKDANDYRHSVYLWIGPLDGVAESPIYCTDALPWPVRVVNHEDFAHVFVQRLSAKNLPE